MKLISFVFFIFIGLASCYEYSDLNEVMEKTFKNVNSRMNYYSNITLNYFYPYTAEQVNRQFQYLAQTVIESRNPYAIAHVVDFRQNYTEISLLLDHIIVDETSKIAKTFELQEQQIAGKKALVEETSRELFEVLSRLRCNDSMYENFYDNLINKTGVRVVDFLNMAFEANFDNLKQIFVPTELFTHFIAAQVKCLPDLATTTDCMVQKDDLYLASSLERISRTIKAIGASITHFNLKVTHAAITDIDKTFTKAYRDAYTIDC